MCELCKVLDKMNPDSRASMLRDTYFADSIDWIQRRDNICKKGKEQIFEAVLAKPEVEDFKYVKYGCHLNEKPEGFNTEYIEIFVSDYNKEYWCFYAYISEENHKEDIDSIWKIISKLNWRDGDTYTELINHSGGLKFFYSYLYKRDSHDHSSVLDPKSWGKERAKAIFEHAMSVFHKQYKTSYISEGYYEEQEGEEWRFRDSGELNGLITSPVNNFYIDMGASFEGTSNLSQKYPVSVYIYVNFNSEPISDHKFIASWYDPIEDKWDGLDWTA